jgi:outer membrane immunogenic protein
MKKLKLALAGTALAGVLASSAMAADCTFSGGYLGTQLGYGTMKTEMKTATGEKSDVGSSGVIGGLHAGFGKQFPNRFYLGLEAYGNLSHTASTKQAKKITRNNSFGAKLRPGVTFGNSLVYGVLGVESANFKGNGNSERFIGFVPGLGIAFNATEHVMIGLEATHTMYKERKDAKPKATDCMARLSYKW